MLGYEGVVLLRGYSEVSAGLQEIDQARGLP
jgi:hypothetical protein